MNARCRPRARHSRASPTDSPPSSVAGSRRMNTDRFDVCIEWTGETLDVGTHYANDRGPGGALATARVFDPRRQSGRPHAKPRLPQVIARRVGTVACLRHQSHADDRPGPWAANTRERGFAVGLRGGYRSRGGRRACRPLRARVCHRAGHCRGGAGRHVSLAFDRQACR